MPYTTINKGSSYFNTVLWTGTGATLSITGVGFKPDWVWTKGRSVAFSHYLMDSVRGVGKRLISNSTSNEDVSIFGVSSFNSDGFTLGTDTGANNSGSTFVGWNWLASNTTTSNTSGTITSTVSVNQTAGFSIVSYSGNGTGGATVGHGLGSALGLIILKCRSTAATSWQMFHKSLGATKSINLEDTAAAATSTAYWNDTAPTSSVFTLGTGGDFNNGSRTYIAYCFAEIKGYSKFGSYTGNGNADGTFVYTGFKPAFVIMKRSDSADSWLMKDSVRDSFNLANKRIFPNQSSAEDTSVNGSIDILSNGFKQRGSDTLTNASGGTYIYMAFAENPFVTSGGIPVTAR